MGLDNGIVVIGIKRNEIPSFVIPVVESSEEFEVCYWRKCWGIRREILKIVNPTANSGYDFIIDLEDIPAILRVMAKYLDNEYWDLCADSIWEYKEYIQHMIQQYINLKWLEGYWKDHPDDDIEVRFYDSY